MDEPIAMTNPETLAKADTIIGQIRDLLTQLHELQSPASWDDTVAIETKKLKVLKQWRCFEWEEPFGYTLVQIRLTDLRKIIGSISPFVALDSEQKKAIFRYALSARNDEPNGVLTPISRDIAHLLSLTVLMERLEAVEAEHEGEAR